jgi:hypothetical protein
VHRRSPSYLALSTLVVDMVASATASARLVHTLKHIDDVFLEKDSVIAESGGSRFLLLQMEK